MSLKYAHEKFHTAVLTLAGHVSIQERLINSYVFSLGHLKTADDIPNALQSRFDELCKELTKFDATGDEGRVQATVSKLNDFEINKLIEDIVSLNDDICMKLALTDETYQDIHQS